MKILQLSKKFPYPLKDGESIAITYLAKAMHQLGAELDLLSMNTSKHPFNIQTLPESFNHYNTIHLVEIDNRVKILDAFLNLFSKKSYHIERYVSPEFEQKLIALLHQNKYDIIHLETLYLAPYISTIRKHSNAKIVMRSHNVEHEIWKRVTDNTTLGAKKWYLNLLTRRLENFEVANLNLYDLLVAITDRDLDFFRQLGCSIPAHVAPIGLDLIDYPEYTVNISQNPSFAFIGSLDWLPNIEALEWLLQEVWPKVLEESPNAKFHIAGRNTPEWLHQLVQPGVIVHGEVPDAVEFIRLHDVFLVPLLSGSGMRVKILEAMAMGKLVISTKIGMEGIHAQHGTEVLLADDPEDFAEQILFCQEQAAKVVAMGQAARTFIRENYENKNIAGRLLEVYQAMLVENLTTSDVDNSLG